MQTLYLIRHTTPDIDLGVCYGQLDIDVAASFAEEANRTRHWLPPFELIVTSPLLRARRLAEYLGQGQRLPLHSDARLMEKNFGAWEGKAWDDIARRDLDAWAAAVMGYAPPGGESAQQLLQRVQDFWQELSHLPQRDIAIVAHGGSIRALLSLIADIPLTRTLNWQMEYGTVICVKNW
ncbi:MAG TPA: alpha-ribazole phosphatase [Gallionella sp.]|nr:alpha-ribazole phosphatase [Gallionella sp.]